MGYYLVDIVTRCDAGACTREAKVELRNAVNGTVGRYCRQHGKRRLAELDNGAH